MEERKYCFVIPLTEEQKAELDRRRKREGRTYQGLMQMMVIDYLKRGTCDGHTDD